MHTLYVVPDLCQCFEQSKNRDCFRIGPRRDPDAFLFLKSRFCCKYIIPNLLQTKKPQRNAEASTTTAMVSLLQSEGR